MWNWTGYMGGNCFGGTSWEEVDESGIWKVGKRNISMWNFLNLIIVLGYGINIAQELSLFIENTHVSVKEWKKWHTKEKKRKKRK